MTTMYYPKGTSALVPSQISDNVIVLVCYGTMGSEGTVDSEGTKDNGQ